MSSSSVNASSSTWLQARLDAIKIARDTLTAGQARQALYADRCSSEDKFKVNDQVLVHRDFLLTCESKDRQSDKLRLKWYGPFVITQQVAPNAFRLQLPHTIKSHPVFNVAALKLYHANQIPGRTVAAPPSVTDMQGFSRYIVVDILSHRSGRGRIDFLLKWEGYTDATSEPERFLQNEIGQDLEPLKHYKQNFIPSSAS